MLMLFVGPDPQSPRPVPLGSATSGNHKTGEAVGFVIHSSQLKLVGFLPCVCVGHRVFLAYGTRTIFAFDFLKCWVCVMLGGHFWGDISAGLGLRHLATMVAPAF